MAVSKAAAYGIYAHNVALPNIVYSLNREGFGNQDICMLLSPEHPQASAMRDVNLLNAEREESAASARTIGWFSEFGAVVIPTVGFFIRSEAFIHALLEQDFPTLSRQSKTLAGLGFPDDDVKRLGQMSDIGALVYVSCPETTRADCAKELLRRAGAQEAASLGKAKAAHAAA